MRKGILVTSLTISLIALPCLSEAGMLFHGTKRALAKRIATKGFSSKMMSAKARYGRGAYLSNSKNTALKEKPHADALVVFRDTSALRKKAINVNHLQKNRIKAITGDRDLRGNIRKGIYGPEIGRKIGQYAARKDKVIIYKSAKDPRGTNIVIPSQVYQRHPNIIRKQGIEYVR